MALQRRQQTVSKGKVDCSDRLTNFSLGPDYCLLGRYLLSGRLLADFSLMRSFSLVHGKKNILLEWKTICRHHNMTPNYQIHRQNVGVFYFDVMSVNQLSVLGRVWPKARGNEMTQAVKGEILFSTHLVSFYEDDMFPFLRKLSQSFLAWTDGC